MLFSSIAIKTSIPATAPAATSGALSVSSIDAENWLQITGEASAGAGSLYLLRWNDGRHTGRRIRRCDESDTAA